MLNIITGRAGTGKTGWIMKEIKRRMAGGERGMYLIVPEQYSHDAERRLCKECGSALSLHAEVLSFTGLCRHVFSETGGGGKRTAGKSGQMLVMHKALETSMPGLRVFGVRKTRTQMLESLLSIIREFKGMCVTADKLQETAAKTSGPLADKLRDFALIMDTYDALMTHFGGDAAGQLDLLKEKIKSSSVGKTGHIYFDGFNDFTMQEMGIIEQLLKNGADMTVCLTCELDAANGAPEAYSEIFEIPRRTAARLGRMPGRIKYATIEENTSGRRDELVFLEKHLFSEAPQQYGSGAGSDAVRILAAPSKYTECEYAAAMILELVRGGRRWRDIGVMARDFGEYEAICSHVFDKYGIPYFSSGRADIHNKPPVALIDSALEIVTMGWEYRHVFKYIKTGLLGLSAEETAGLENYVTMWNIRGTLWHREWLMPPSGYAARRSGKISRQDDEKLRMLNALREKIARPLARLADAVKGETPAGGKLRGLHEFLTEISLHENLASKADGYNKRGQLREAGEYVQLSNIITDATDQIYAILGDTPLSAEEFRKLTQLVFSQHDVGVIPVSLDRVPLGSMPMSRRRDLKCLIMLGSTDENMPRLTQGAGLLSDNERKTLSKLDDNITSGFEERFYREMNTIYLSLTLPSEKLIMIYGTSAPGGRPSFIVRRLCEMFNIREETLAQEQYMSAAPVPYDELLFKQGGMTNANARGKLSAQSARMLYGGSFALSPTRADSYYSCPYKHFLQSGLKLKPLQAAQFDAMTAGLYMHHVLEGVFKELKAGPGFKDVSDALLRTLAGKYTDEYVKEVLRSFEGKNKRFAYLFRNYEKSVLHTARDMIDELECSRFEPFSFEMNIADINDGQRGFIDRVDTFDLDGTLYFRIIDYKTRRKAYEFSLSDVLGGRDMQMLIYLFALAKNGGAWSGRTPLPAGVLYAPARDLVLGAERGATPEELSVLRSKSMKRSGLILNEDAVIEAMEGGSEKRYLPVKRNKEGKYSGGSLASRQQINLLAKYVDGKMDGAAQGILSGNNECTPYYKDGTDNACAYCDYPSVCGFDEQLGDKRNYSIKKSTAEAWEEIAKDVS